MVPETLTDYEQRRLENIRLNGEMVASLLLHRKASDLSASLKRPYKRKARPPAPKDPLVLRRSPRTRGIPPSSAVASTSTADEPPSPLLIRDAVFEPPSPRRPGPLLIRDAVFEPPTSSDDAVIDAILTSSGDPGPDIGRERAGFDPRSSMVLRPSNVKKVVPGRILSVGFFPLSDRTVVAAGDKLGHVGLWDAEARDGDGVCVYFPHSAAVSGISIHPFSQKKMYTSSYDGFIRLMDVEGGTFNMIYCSDDPMFSICQRPDDINSLYLGEGTSELKVWDVRAGKALSSWFLHKHRINTIDFSSGSTNLMATSSTDRTACIWDLRYMENDQPKSIKRVKHQKAVHSAFFSPSGNYFATSSGDDRVRILTGANFDDLSMIKHDSKTGVWLSSFRAIWGWDDSCLFMGNMKRAVDVISTADGSTTALESSHMTSIPCRFAAHPFNVGTIACAASGGKVYLWTGS